MLDPNWAKTRRTRLLPILAERKLDAAVIGWRWHVSYFTTHIPFWQQQSALILTADGRTTLVAARGGPIHSGVGEVREYEATFIGTHRPNQAMVVGEMVESILKERGLKHIGFDTSRVSSAVQLCSGIAGQSIDADLWQLRRRKDPDELALMRKAIGCAGGMYARARQILEPGIPELRVFGELHAVAVDLAGEPLSAYLGNDFQCGTMGGPPRSAHSALPGQIYILDLGPAYRGYFADSSRGFSIGRQPTDLQMRAWECLMGVFPLVERLAKPGTKCRELFNVADQHLRQSFGQNLVHHLGHGVGLSSHEFPHLNPNYDETLIEGEVFTCEPGLYNDQLNGGIRLENMYLVTKTGVENLTPFPMELT